MRKARTIFTQDEIKAMEEAVAQGYLKFGDVMDIEALKWSQSVIKPERQVQHMNRVTTEIIKGARSKAGYPHKHSPLADKKMHASPPPYAATQTELALIPPADVPTLPAAAGASTPAPEEKESKRNAWTVNETFDVYEEAFDRFFRNPSADLEEVARVAQMKVSLHRRKSRIDGKFLRIIERAQGRAATYNSTLRERGESRRMSAQDSVPAPEDAAAKPAPASPTVIAEKGGDPEASGRAFEAEILRQINDEIATRVNSRLQGVRASLLAKMEAELT